MNRDHPFDDYRNRRITVMGLGSFGGGLGAVKFLAARGARLTITDSRPAEKLADSLAELKHLPIDCWRLGEHREEDFLQAELVVVNPAVPWRHPLLATCRHHGIPLTSEMNLFWQHNRGAVFAVTGSNGKSTTTALLHSILSRGSRRCWLGGNLGKSLLPDVEAIEPDDRVVLELSSFQLADLNRLQVSPQVAIVTNFAANHLDWHGKLAHYRAAKQTILRWQTRAGTAVLNRDDPEVCQWQTQAQRIPFSLQDQGIDGVFWNGREGVRRTGRQVVTFPVRDWLKLPGRHNLANALAATAAALAAGAELCHIKQGLQTYEPLPHRLQLVGEAAGRKFYNDSLATTPESTLVALEAFQAPVVLLAGGYDKRVDLQAMAAEIARSTKAVSLMGQTADGLRQQIAAQPLVRTRCSPAHVNFQQAFDWAMEQSSPGDVILLSPGCASYDWFRNFADRGTQFQQLAETWMARHSH